MSIKPLFDAFRDYISMRTEPEFEETFANFNWNLSERNVTPNKVAVSSLVDTLPEHSGRGEMRMVNEMIAHQDQLLWGQSYTAEDFGEAFVNNYGYLEMIGTRGHYVCDEIAGGFVFFGPNCNYPEHWHMAEELYVPITNDGLWSRDEGPYVKRKAGEFIYHESNMPHAMKTEQAPLLALYIWRNGDLAQKCNY